MAGAFPARRVATSYNHLIGRPRSANLVDANPQRMESADKARWACGRNVKVSVGDGRFDVVESWTLKARINGKAVVVRSHCAKAEALEYIA